jgi:hypothetical protein
MIELTPSISCSNPNAKHGKDHIHYPFPANPQKYHVPFLHRRACVYFPLQHCWNTSLRRIFSIFYLRSKVSYLSSGVVQLPWLQACCWSYWTTNVKTRWATITEASSVVRSTNKITLFKQITVMSAAYPICSSCVLTLQTHTEGNSGNTQKSTVVCTYNTVKTIFPSPFSLFLCVVWRTQNSTRTHTAVCPKKRHFVQHLSDSSSDRPSPYLAHKLYLINPSGFLRYRLEFDLKSNLFTQPYFVRSNDIKKLPLQNETHKTSPADITTLCSRDISHSKFSGQWPSRKQLYSTRGHKPGGN